MIHYCDLARDSLQHWLMNRTKLETDQRAGFRSGCFVSLHTESDELRGCIGTIDPARDDIVNEVLENAVSAGTRDPRFSPVTLTELENLKLEVSVLKPPEIIWGVDQLDPKRFGLVLAQGAKRGVLLPDLEGIDTVDQQIAITKKKASITDNGPCRMWRFEVEKYHEQHGRSF